MERGVGRGSGSEGEEPSTTTTNNTKLKRKGKKSRRLQAACPVESSEDEDLKKALELSLNAPSSEDEDMKRVLELSKREVYYIPDSDEEMKAAIRLSLAGDAEPGNKSSIVISDDEFDDMCKDSNLSLKERLSKSSLSSGEDPQPLDGGADGGNEALQVPQPSSSRTYMGSKVSKKGRGRFSAAAAASRAAEAASIHLDEDEDDREDEFSQTCENILGMNSLSSTVYPSLHRTDPHGHSLSSEEATRRMRGVFARGLESKLNQEEMEPCRAITTKLHSHQKSALAWMVRHENKENQGMIGGILADEMGLGKTLTVLSLILTNHYEGRPIAKPSLGFVRPKVEMTRGGGKGKRKPLVSAPVNSNVGKKLKEAEKSKKRSAFGFFSNFNSSDDEERTENRTKFSFGASAAKTRKRAIKGFINDEEEESGDSDVEFDEFDKMDKEPSLASRLKSSSEQAPRVRDPREEELDDMYAEWETMSQEQKDEKMRSLSNPDVGELNPGLNLDGAFDSESDDEDLQPNHKKVKVNVFDSSDDEKGVVTSMNSCGGLETKKTKIQKNYQIKLDSDSDSDVHLSDVDLENIPPPPRPVAATTSVDEPTTSCADPQPGPSRPASQATRIVPPKDPAVRGNRPRPTLIVCPTSLLSHWCHEIDVHVDPSVDIKVKVHHGQNKAKLGADLNTYDIVITTYGTLANELDADTSPLLRARWLRVVLDEGHFIKNYRSKTAKAANLLNTKRRWVVTGTPIQNNLIELWSLVNWLRFDLYADNLSAFKAQIEQPCKARQECGFERLQTLVDAICLRRTKNDKKANGDPIVPLPPKTIIIRDVNFTPEEKLCYTILNTEARNIVERYQRRGELLRNYAHIFALMMRLRQLCCHRELIREIDWTHTIRDKENLERELAHLLQQEGLGGGEANLTDEDQAKRLAAQLRKMIRDGVTEDCSICLDDLKSPVITPCAHVYCRQCIERVLETSRPPLCPLCRGGVDKKSLLEAGNDEEETKATEDETLKALESIEVNVSSSKVNAALKEMIRIRTADPSDKIIVVSQFTSFLSIFQPILAEHGFNFVRLDGTMSHMDRADVVRLFQKKTESAPKVLLLSLKAGGVGLNLTAANHLLLLDPAWNPAAEWQCFDRTHRIGQEKNVYIYKFITKDESIEEKMMQIQAKKEELISGAFHMPDEDRRRQRINDIINIFNIGPAAAPAIPAPALPAPALPAAPAHAGVVPAPAPTLALPAPSVPAIN